ncbi:MAG: NHL repeat-containing protein [Gemmatimonadota bacterium]
MTDPPPDGNPPPDPPPPPPPEPTQVQAATSLSVLDGLNTGSAADLSLSFALSNSTDIEALRIFIVASSVAASFDTAAAAAVPAGQFQEVAATGASLFLDAATLTAAGDPVVEGTAYQIFVLSVAVGADRLNALSSGSAAITLAQTDLVLTLVDDHPAGTGAVTVGPDGMIYVADSGRQPNLGGTQIFRIDPAGDLQLFASSSLLNTPLGGAFDSNGLLHWASFGSSRILRIDASGTVSTFVTDGLVGPVGIAFDAADTLFVANCQAGSIQKISPDGTSVPLATSGLLSCPNGITVGPDDNLYVVNFNDGRVLQVTRAGDVTVFANLPGNNNGHITYRDGLFYVVARGAHRIFTVDMAGTATAFAGSGARGFADGPPESATLSLPNGIAFNADGSRLYFNSVRSSVGGDNGPMQVRYYSFEAP